MGLLRGYAIGIDEVRDIFGADQRLAAHLRALASDAFPAPNPPARTLLNRLGPLFRRDAALVVDPTMPTSSDVEGLLTGRFCPPERRAPSWLVVHRWLADLSWGSIERPLGQTELDDLDFALAKAGLPSPFALGRLLAGDAQLPLLPAPGMSVGYAKHHLVMAMWDALADVVPRLEAPDAEQVTTLLDFLSCFSGWAQDAQSQSRPAPDLLTIWDR